MRRMEVIRPNPNHSPSTNPDYYQNQTVSSVPHVPAFHEILWKSDELFLRSPAKQASKKVYSPEQYYDNINTKCKQYNGRLPEGNPSIELVAYSKYSVYNINSEEKEVLGANIKKKWEADNRDTPALCYGMWKY